MIHRILQSAQCNQSITREAHAVLYIAFW